MELLTDRRQQLLQLIVDEYVTTAQPVGSSAIVDKYRLPFSPATVRNEMARLEEEGYISQPHTSAGRVPTDRGYRYYLALLVVVLQEARVLQQALALDRPYDQEELTAIARRLNDLYSGMTTEQIAAASAELAPMEASVVDSAVTMLERADEDEFEPSYLEGLRDLLRQPEFAQSERILNLLELLEGRNLPKAISLGGLSSHQVSIVIGGEHPVDAMRVCSVVSARYGESTGLRGIVTVVGPTRMHYPRSVSLVRYMSSLMDELLGVYFA